jgi:hypothetical protein
MAPFHMDILSEQVSAFPADPPLTSTRYDMSHESGRLIASLTSFSRSIDLSTIIVTALGRASPRHLISSKLVSNYE